MYYLWYSECNKNQTHTLTIIFFEKCMQSSALLKHNIRNSQWRQRKCEAYLWALVLRVLSSPCHQSTASPPFPYKTNTQKGRRTFISQRRQLRLGHRKILTRKLMKLKRGFNTWLSFLNSPFYCPAGIFLLFGLTFSLTNLNNCLNLYGNQIPSYSIKYILPKVYLIMSFTHLKRNSSSLVII